MHIHFRRVGVAAAATALTLSSQVALAPPAFAERCTRNNWNVDVYGRYFSAGYKVGGGPGVTLTIRKSRTITVNASTSATVGLSVRGVVAEANAQVSATVGVSVSDTLETSAVWKVPKKWKRGILAAGADKYKIRVTNYIRQPDCDLITVRRGKTRVVENFVTYARWRDR